LVELPPSARIIPKAFRFFIHRKKFSLVVEQIFNDLVQQYGIYAVFLLCMVEGDITLLLAGVLAHASAFGEYSYAKVVFFGTLGAVAGDFFGYWVGRVFQKRVQNYKFYQRSQPRIEKLTQKFGALSIFVSKYIYGIRAAWCIFFGVSGTPWYRFLAHDALSCFLWVTVTSGIGYLFGGAVMNLIGDIHKVGYVLLIILICGVIGFYLFERFYVSKKVEEVSPESLHEIEKAAHITLHDINEKIQEKLHLGSSHHNQNNGHKNLNQPTQISKTARKGEKEK
jgi:membrane protein DedA with SNARE-associated domain